MEALMEKPTKVQLDVPYGLIIYALLPRWVQLILIRSLQVIALLLLIYMIRAGFFTAIWEHGLSSLLSSIWDLVKIIFKMIIYGVTGYCNNPGGCGMSEG